MRSHRYKDDTFPLNVNNMPPFRRYLSICGVKLYFHSTPGAGPPAGGSWPGARGGPGAPVPERRLPVAVRQGPGAGPPAGGSRPGRRFSR